MDIQVVKIKDIKSNPNNPRVIKDDKFHKLCESIKSFPKMLELRPIVVNDDMVVLGGNMRLKALKHLGLTEAPVIKASDLTEDQQRQFVIKDNAGFGEWDWDMLANEWDIQELESWGIDVPAFALTELEAEEDDFQIPEDGIATDIVIGDLFEIGEHRLLCGDSTDIDKVELLMNGQEVNLLTDPPYGINANKQTLGTGKKKFHRGDDWDVEVPDFYYVLELVNKAIIWGGNYFADKLPINNDWLCWHKKNDGLSLVNLNLLGLI